jgi:hypothetical protein
MEDEDPRAHYDRGLERDRLAQGVGILEFARTTEIVVRPGGPVFVAALSRWGARLAGVLKERIYLKYPQVHDVTTQVERTGQLPPLGPGSFAGYCHRPQQLRAELRDAGLAVADLVSIQGPAFLLADLAERCHTTPQSGRIPPGGLSAANGETREPQLVSAPTRTCPVVSGSRG